MSYLQDSLAVDEQVISIFHLHWINKLRALHWMALAIPTFGLTLIGVFYEWLRLRSIEQAVTNRRVMRKTGILSRETEELRLSSIETIDLHQSAWGRMLGFGDVLLTGRGESTLRFRTVANPIAVKQAIETAYSANVETTQ